jgi:hypothetical protein
MEYVNEDKEGVPGDDEAVDVQGREDHVARLDDAVDVDEGDHEARLAAASVLPNALQIRQHRDLGGVRRLELADLLVLQEFRDDRLANV